MQATTEGLGKPQDTFAQRLVDQERARLKAIKRVYKLREKASAEITRLIAFLDAADDYVMTELEDDDDREPVGDEEPSLGSLDRAMDQSKWPRGNQWDVDAELDTSDDEPSLGSIERPCSAIGWRDGPNPTGDQTRWGDSPRNDLEDEHDGREPDDDNEPTLGSRDHNHSHALWASGDTQDLEQDDGESGIGDQDGLLEQVGTHDWQHGGDGVMDVMDPELNRHLNEIDGQLHEIECMAEFAAGLAEDIDGDGAKPGYFQIEISKGDRLAFCCYDLLRRINLVRDSVFASGGTKEPRDKQII